MRVPGYEKQISPQVPTVRSGVQIPEGAAGVTADLSPLQRGVETFALGLGKMQEQREQFELAEAVNDFRRKNTEFLNAKDNGVFSQQGKSVWGSTARYDGFAVETLEGIAKERKMDGTRRARFAQAVAGLRDSSMGSVMRFEQAQSKKVADAEFDITMEDSLNALSLCYDDDEACRAQIEIAIGANSAKYADFGGAVVSQNEQKLISKAQAFRTQAMLQQDPRKAEAFFAAHEKEILPEDRLKLKTAIDKQADLLWTQETADGYMKKFSDEKAALADVRKRFEGEREERLVSALKTRFNEKEIKSAASDAALHKKQQSVYEQIMDDITIRGKLPTLEQLEQCRLNKEIGVNHFTSLKNSLASLATRGTAEKGVRLDPEYSTLGPAEIESKVRQSLGVSDEMRSDVVSTLNDGLWNGTLTGAELSDAYTRGFISKEEAEQYRKDAAGIVPAQKSFARDEQSMALKRIKNLAGYEKPFMADDFNVRVNEKVRSLDPKSPDYRKQVRDACNDVTAELVNENFKSKYSWGGWIEADFFLNEAGKLLKLTQNNAYAGDAFGGVRRYNADPSGAGKAPKADETIRADDLNNTLRK